MTLEVKKGVDYVRPEYEAHRVKWKRCRDVMAGQDAVHDAKERYLSRLNEQTNDDYKAYVTRAGFYNASWRTVAGLVGMMFRKPPKQEVPKGIEEYLENVTLSGMKFAELAKAVATEVLEVGRVGLLVDHPVAPVKEDGTETTVAEAEKLGLRPTIQMYTTEAIINWKHKNVNNVTALSMVVLEELFAFDDGEFAQGTETRWRVLDLDAEGFYRVRVFRKNEKKEDVLVSEVFPHMNGQRLPFIPFLFIQADGCKAEPDDPPLIDLVNVNVAHYRVNANYEHGCFYTGLPTPWVAGYQSSLTPDGKPEKLYIGSQSAWLFSDPNAKAGYLEFSGTGLDALWKNLESKKQEMATLGARMLADTSTRQVETFGATAIKHVGENSILASIAISESDGLKQALTWFAEWAGQASEIKYDINREFLPVQMDAPTLTAYVGAWQQGALSETELFETLKRGDVIDSEKTLEEHQAEIDQAPPPAPPSNTQAGELGTLSHDEQIAKDAKAAAAMPVKKAA